MSVLMMWFYMVFRIILYGEGSGSATHIQHTGQCEPKRFKHIDTIFRVFFKKTLHFAAHRRFLAFWSADNNVLRTSGCTGSFPLFMFLRTSVSFILYMAVILFSLSVEEKKIMLLMNVNKSKLRLVVGRRRRNIFLLKFYV